MSVTKQKGLTLVELLVSLALAATIIAGILQVFLANREAYNLTESMVRVQENGRFALNFISDSLRKAGDYGCVSEFDSNINNIQSQIPGGLFNDINAIQTAAFPGIGSSTDGAAPAVGVDWFDEPDEITLMLPTNNTGRIGNVLTYPTTLEVIGGDFEENDFVLVSSCQVGDFIVLDNGTDSDQIVDATNELRTDFYQLQNVVSEVTEVNIVKFWVNKDPNQGCVDCLNVTQFNNGAGVGNVETQTLLNGIDNLQFTYGVDTDRDFVANYFDNITNVRAAGDVANIVAIKVYVMAVSGSEGEVQNVVSQPQTLTLDQFDADGDAIARVVPDATDLRLRRVFESTVTMRNKVN